MSHIQISIKVFLTFVKGDEAMGRSNSAAQTLLEALGQLVLGPRTCMPLGSVGFSNLWKPMAEHQVSTLSTKRGSYGRSIGTLSVTV